MRALMRTTINADLTSMEQRSTLQAHDISPPARMTSGKCVYTSPRYLHEGLGVNVWRCWRIYSCIAASSSESSLVTGAWRIFV